MDNDFNALEVLCGCGALKKGHFRLSSGLHSDTYVQCSTMLKNPALALLTGRAIAEAVGEPVDVVLSPALGAVVIGFATATAFACESIFAERVAGSMVLRRGFRIAPGARVLLVEDVITTGGSILELARLVEDAAGSVVALACIVQRGDFDAGGRKIVALSRVSAESYIADECPLCAQGVKIDSPGSRRIRVE
ncbi:MAG: orotate phosphoribosyltransferase [Candidatus Anoxymicrobium japonicum]|uniref:Orotate phosphoribosyltransferase n=1 Tax=Candidatus Anoxymicrobium japonicum TaxID=2013648 RepID=A0A2N3G4H5_9ACTN|nr:MAG: orotate phosphoribosyltransferase [Candidatus Anoxymicrobium japonicum]